MDDLINRIKHVDIDDKKHEEIKDITSSNFKKSPPVCIDLLDESIVNGNIKNRVNVVSGQEKPKGKIIIINDKSISEESFKSPISDKENTNLSHENSLFSPKSWNFADLSCLNFSEEIKSRVSIQGKSPKSNPPQKFDNSADLFVTPECRRPIELSESSQNFSESPVLVSLADRLKNKKKVKFPQIE